MEQDSMRKDRLLEGLEVENSVLKVEVAKLQREKGGSRSAMVKIKQKQTEEKVGERYFVNQSVQCDVSLSGSDKIFVLSPVKSPGTKCIDLLDGKALKRHVVRSEETSDQETSVYGRSLYVSLPVSRNPAPNSMVKQSTLC